MGTYVYSLRSPKLIRKVRLDTGDIMTVGVYDFHFKPYFSMWDKEPRWQRLCWAQIARLEQIWNGFISKGGAWPQGAAITFTDDAKGEKPHVKVGNTVITWPGRQSPPISFYDDNEGAWSKRLGKVAEILG